MAGDLGATLDGSGWTVPGTAGDASAGGPAGALGATLDADGWKVPKDTSGSVSPNLTAGGWTVALQRILAAINLRRKPLCNPIMAHNRGGGTPTGGPNETDYRGFSLAVGPGELPSRGMRIVRNLFASTATLATQGVTVEAADYWLSFTGTGSVAVSGVAIDSLAGTGASNRVSKKITAGSAGTATFTVTGSVTDAQLTKSRPGQAIADPEYVSKGVLSAPYHGWGADGLDKLDKDEYGNPLPLGLGPEWSDDLGFDDAAAWHLTSAVTVAGGALTIGAAGNISGKKSLPVNKTYDITLVIDSITPGGSSVRVYAGSTGAGTARTTPGTFTERITATGVPALYLFTGGTFGTATISRLSAREVYPVACVGPYTNIAITNRLTQNQDAASWTKRGAATIADADDGTVEGGYLQLRGIGAVGVDDVYRYHTGFTLSEALGVALLIRPVDTAGTLRLQEASAGSTKGQWDINLALLPAGRWSLVNKSHASVTATVDFSAGSTSAGLHFIGPSGSVDVDIALPTLAAGTLYCAGVVPAGASAVTCAADVLTADLSLLGFTEGTILVSHVPAFAPSVNVNTQEVCKAITDASNFALIYNQSGNFGIYVANGGVAQWSSNAAGGNWTAGTRQNIALRLEANNGRLSSDSTMRLTDSAMTIPTVPTLYLGSGVAGGKYVGGFPALVILGPGQTDAQVDTRSTTAAIDALVSSGGAVVAPAPTPAPTPAPAPAPDYDLAHFEWESGFANPTGIVGGTVVHVTNLNASGAGSFAAACAGSGARIVVFDVSGVIDLGNTFVDITNPNIWIAGQTAPAPGITIIKGQLRTFAANVIIQHLAVRPGTGAPGKDAFEFREGSVDCIVDHCSFTWGMDECASAAGATFSGADLTAWRENMSHRVTFSNCIVGQPIYDTGIGAQGYGMLLEDNVTEVLVYGCYIPHCQDRSPNLGGAGQACIVNNLIYNNKWKHIDYTFLNSKWDTYAGGARVVGKMTAIGNVGRDGPITSCNAFFELVSNYDIDYYKLDNICTLLAGTNPRVDGSNHLETYLSTFVTGGAINVVGSPNVMPTGLVPMAASAVEAYVHNAVGARPWNRDSIDQALLDDHTNGTGNTISTQVYPTRANNTRVFNSADWDMTTMQPNSFSVL